MVVEANVTQEHDLEEALENVVCETVNIGVEQTVGEPGLALLDIRLLSARAEIPVFRVAALLDGRGIALRFAVEVQGRAA